MHRLTKPVSRAKAKRPNRACDKAGDSHDSIPWIDQGGRVATCGRWTEGWRPKKTRSRRINVQLTAPALEGRGWFYPYRASGRHPDHRHSCRDRDSVVPEPEGQGSGLLRQDAG